MGVDVRDPPWPDVGGGGEETAVALSADDLPQAPADLPAPRPPLLRGVPDPVTGGAPAPNPPNKAWAIFSFSVSSRGFSPTAGAGVIREGSGGR